ncbi:hypothetical protein [Burkholderia sp. Ac-20365]|nr:hypothetical protein [Burkholderia sp. Ac-20365]
MDTLEAGRRDASVAQLAGKLAAIFDFSVQGDDTRILIPFFAAYHR